ncbi:MAG: MerR family transcriptional regulator [Ilumatobacter sp.]
MAEVHDTGYLSIGEVLGLLLEDFPDVTISKIRFLESQGLISPERTASGYRKFYDPDVELLRVILTEQKSNYLPLRVIKDRLETGEIDPTGEHLRPNGDDDNPGTAHAADGHVPAEPVEVPSESVSSHPSSRSGANSQTAPSTAAPVSGPANGAGGAVAATVQDPSPVAEQPVADEPVESSPASLMPGVLLDRAELCSMVKMTDEELQQLESFGIVSARDGSQPSLYGDDAVEIAKPACEFLRSGVDARHLRNWRTSADREASLYEQLVTPRFRQRNPESRAEALAQLKRLDALGGSLRAAMTRQALRRHFES